MQSYFLFGFLATLCHQASGLEFIDKIRANVNGEALYLLHDVESPTSVKFGNSPNSNSYGWKFNTAGFSDDDAVITPSDSDKTLICEEDSPCTLNLDGPKQPYRVVRISSDPIYTFQDLATGLYVSRTPELGLELSPDSSSDNAKFILEHFLGKIPRVVSYTCVLTLVRRSTR
jgi:hypothetical protein